jgi:RimJ/RimL family protein N-acetyltransferase
MILWFQDMEVTSTLMMRFPPSLDDEEAWLKRVASSPNDVIWAIEHDGEAIGTTGIHGINWLDRNAGTGTVIGDRRHWGKGIGGELMRLRTRYAFTQLPLHKLTSAFNEGNEASRRAQLAAGYREIGRHREQIWRDGRWHDLVLTEVLRDDWLSSQDGGPKR